VVGCGGVSLFGVGCALLMWRPSPPPPPPQKRTHNKPKKSRPPPTPPYGRAKTRSPPPTNATEHKEPPTHLGFGWVAQDPDTTKFAAQNPPAAPTTHRSVCFGEWLFLLFTSCWVSPYSKSPSLEGEIRGGFLEGGKGTGKNAGPCETGADGGRKVE